jgi:hypothetical protein
MGRRQAGHRGDLPGRHSARGSSDKPWDKRYPEDDPLQDLRPHDDEPEEPAGDEYVWPDLTDDNEEDD